MNGNQGKKSLLKLEFQKIYNVIHSTAACEVIL